MRDIFLFSIVAKEDQISSCQPLVKPVMTAVVNKRQDRDNVTRHSLIKAL